MNSEVHFLCLCYFPFFPPLFFLFAHVSVWPHSLIFENWREKTSPVIVPLSHHYILFWSFLPLRMLVYSMPPSKRRVLALPGTGRSTWWSHFISQAQRPYELGVGTFTISDLQVRPGREGCALDHTVDNRWFNLRIWVPHLCTLPYFTEAKGKRASQPRRGHWRGRRWEPHDGDLFKREMSRKQRVSGQRQQRDWQLWWLEVTGPLGKGGCWPLMPGVMLQG